MRLDRALDDLAEIHAQVLRSEVYRGYRARTCLLTGGLVLAAAAADSVAGAARIDEKELLGDLGVEQLTAKGGIGAIIHDKVVVIDPRSPDCTVILGSHNLGFKASYSNDENLVIVTGDAGLAAAYAVHILDVYDHYRFRAIENERKREGKTGWSGFLAVKDDWQDGYVSGAKGAISRYFAR